MKIEQTTEDIKAIAATEHGMRFLLRLISEAGIYQTTFHPANPAAGAYAEGRRAMGLTIQQWLNAADPNIYLRLVQANAENITREREQRTRRNAKRNDESGSDDTEG